MKDLLDQIYIEAKWETLPSGDCKCSILIEENCECMVNNGEEGPEGGWFLHSTLEAPSPDCPNCEGRGRFTYVKEEIHSSLNNGPIPF